MRRLRKARHLRYAKSHDRRESPSRPAPRSRSRRSTARSSLRQRRAMPSRPSNSRCNRRHDGHRARHRGLPLVRIARHASQGFILMSPCDFQAQLKSPLKAVGTHHYVHLDGFQLLPADATAKLVAAESLAQITRGDRYNVARFDNSHSRVSLLNYPSFFEDAFPALHESWNVDLTPAAGREWHDQTHRARRIGLRPSEA